MLAIALVPTNAAPTLDLQSIEVSDATPTATDLMGHHGLKRSDKCVRATEFYVVPTRHRDVQNTVHVRVIWYCIDSTFDEVQLALA